MEPTDVMACFERTGAILRNDHFVYASSLHGSMYINKKMLYTDAWTTALLCKEMACRALAFGPIACVVGPERGGIILAQWVGYFLNEISECRVRSVYAEKSGPHFIFSDDYADLVRGKDVLLVDDVVTTGGSLRNLASCVRKRGGKIHGAVALCNRGSVAVDYIGVPDLVCLMDITTESWLAHQCPLCAKGISVNSHYGRGKEFLLRQTNQTPQHCTEF